MRSSETDAGHRSKLPSVLWMANKTGVCHAVAFVAVLHFFSAADKADFITGLGKALGEFSKERGAVLSRT